MENDDKFLQDYRRDPAAGYARRLRETLREQEDVRPGRAWRPLVAAAATLAVVAGLFAFPAVRAGAQAMLDLFRVRNFVAVPFNGERLEKLQSLERDNAMLVFDRHEVIQDPGKPSVVESPASASAAVGFAVATPGYLPSGMALDTIAVTGEGRARLGVSSARLREILATLDLRDVDVPAGLDGQDVTVHMYPAATQRFHSQRHRLALIQARSPEVSLPAGWDLARLGEIGLRILGLDAGEARRMAASVDWRSTLLVPVPANASSFRTVTVQGQPGLLVTTSEREGRRGGTAVLWTQGDRIFALQGTIGETNLMQVAESVR